MFDGKIETHSKLIRITYLNTSFYYYIQFQSSTCCLYQIKRFRYGHLKCSYLNYQWEDNCIDRFIHVYQWTIKKIHLHIFFLSQSKVINANYIEYTWSHWINVNDWECVGIRMMRNEFIPAKITEWGNKCSFSLVLLVSLTMWHDGIGNRLAHCELRYRRWNTIAHTRSSNAEWGEL